MSKPSVKQVGSVFTFTWTDEAIAARVDHVRRHTNGNISSEITVKSSRPGVPGHIYHGDMSNMLGPRVRSDVVKGCASRSPDLPWEQMIETVCEHVIERFRQGKQPILLADVETKESLRWRVYPWLMEKMPTLIFGKGGGGKTTLSAWLAIRVAAGIDAEPGQVTIIDWESTEDDWRERVSMIAKGMGISDPGISMLYIEGNESLPHGIEEYQQQVQEFNTDLLVIDSAGYACGGDAGEQGTTMEYFRALRSFNCTSLTIAHQTQDEGTKRPYGSVYWWNSPRSIMQVIRSEEDSDKDFEVGVYQRKRNNTGRMKPMGFKIAFDTQDEMVYTEGDSVTISPMSITEIPDLASTASNPDRILDLLKHGRLNVAAIGMELNLDVNIIRTTLHRMKTQGKVQQVGDSDWGLPDHSYSQPEYQ